jgi:hypothetical protein
MDVDGETSLLVAALGIPWSMHAVGRCWPQGGHNNGERREVRNTVMRECWGMSPELERSDCEDGDEQCQPTKKERQAAERRDGGPSAIARQRKHVQAARE